MQRSKAKRSAMQRSKAEQGATKQGSKGQGKAGYNRAGQGSNGNVLPSIPPQTTYSLLQDSSLLAIPYHKARVQLSTPPHHQEQACWSWLLSPIHFAQLG